MLKTGIYLLTVSSTGVIYRNADLSYSMIPSLKWFCLAGLCLSLACFIATYISFGSTRFQKVFTRRSDMIKSLAWKFSSPT